VTVDGSFAARWALTGDWQLSSAVELGRLGVHRPGEPDGAGPTDYVETTASIALSAGRRW
jgi:hypothetical protein